MPEPVDAWWARRRFSTGRTVPYAPGTFRDLWRSYPVLLRWYHPDLNHGVLLSQVPLAADVWLQWQCDAGHLFIATPAEQRFRPGRERRRSSWCPQCLAEATGRGRAPRPAMIDTAAVRVAAPSAGPADPAEQAGQAGPTSPSASAHLAAPAAESAGSIPGVSSPAPRRPSVSRTRRQVCPLTPALTVGEPFVSACAPSPASAVEADLRTALAQRLEFEPGLTAVRLSRPFFDHREAWPDIVLGELRVAIEYDSTGRHGLEHVGPRQVADERKDRYLRTAGWEVIRVRTGRLPLIGPHDLPASGISARLITQIVDELRAIHGPLLVDAYLRP